MNSVMRGKSQDSVVNMHFVGGDEVSEVKGPHVWHERSASQFKVGVEPLSKIEGRRHLDLVPLQVNVDSLRLDDDCGEESKREIPVLLHLLLGHVREVDNDILGELIVS